MPSAQDLILVRYRSEKTSVSIQFFIGLFKGRPKIGPTLQFFTRVSSDVHVQIFFKYELILNFNKKLKNTMKKKAN